MIYHFNIDSIIEFITAFAALVTILILWRYKKQPEVKFLMLLQLMVVIWAITYAFEFATTDLNRKILWSQLSYLGIAFTPGCYFFFAVSFSQKSNYVTRKNILLSLILPVITLALVLTNQQHRLVWSDVTLDPVANIAHYHHGPWFWVFWGYVLLLIIMGFFTLLRSIYQFTAYYKSQIAILLISTLIPIVANLMYVTGYNPYPGFDWTPVSFVVTGLIISLGIIRYKMFDLVPFARNELFDNMDDGVIVVNSNGIIEDCNPSGCAIFGFNKKTIIRQPFSVLFSEYPDLIATMNQNNFEYIQLEITPKRKNRFFQVSISPIYYKNKNFSGNLLLFHDVTALKNTENNLKMTNLQLVDEIHHREKLIEDLDAFAHTVAHDLKNSLGSIVSASELMEEIIRSNNTKLLNDLASLIKTSASKTLKITQELLILATVSHQEIVKKKLDMGEIILEAQKNLQDTIQKSGAVITTPHTWPASAGYAPWVEEVWMNYLTNAIKYGGTPPEIIIGADRQNNGMVRFWIKDNGNGIPKEEQSKLFKKYIRLSPASAEGYGLGLSIVKRIIEKLDGAVGVESTGKPGEGSLFWFELPEFQHDETL
ncbi:MAG: PAS domain S-box protein [Bacteroidia bacterium]|nr:PAS domain S-box protein [Bacteroidia bacterium]